MIKEREARRRWREKKRGRRSQRASEREREEVGDLAWGGRCTKREKAERDREVERGTVSGKCDST